MMIDKRLIGTVADSKKYIAGNVISQWISLAANICMMGAIAQMLQHLYEGAIGERQIALTAGIAVGAIGLRFLCAVVSARMGYLSSREVKKTLRRMIYKKLLRLGSSYKEQANTSEVVQVAVEGVDQLETYFGSYLPQLFYAMLAPLTLFFVLSFVNFPSALVLFVCVPMIPVTIIMIQRWAKKLLAKYWGQYTALGDTFLENLQGLTTTKIYQADVFKHKEMNEQSEHFRKITMKVLTMQLNSITIMDLIAYGGAALGVILAVMAASDKIFRLLDLPEPDQKTEAVQDDCSIECRNLRFSYEAGREILHGVDMKFPKGSFTAIVGESGCGKSTIASILMGRNKEYDGDVTVGKTQLSEINEASLMKKFTYISHQSYLFKGTVRENLLMAQPDAGEAALWNALERVNLADFLRGENGLDTVLNEKASNLSGGQCQRLALARALLHDSPVYIFDEATSNIDVESENDIMKQIYELAETKTVILISHRLANVAGADNIYVLDKGTIMEHGDHKTLLSQNGTYTKLWNAQQKLECYTKGETWDEEKWI